MDKINTSNDMSAWEGFMRGGGEPKSNSTMTLICSRSSCGGKWQATPGRGRWNFCPHCKCHFFADELVQKTTTQQQRNATAASSLEDWAEFMTAGELPRKSQQRPPQPCDNGRSVSNTLKPTGSNGGALTKGQKPKGDPYLLFLKENYPALYWEHQSNEKARRARQDRWHDRHPLKIFGGLNTTIS